jgi:membrane dipeptidase
MANLVSSGCRTSVEKDKSKLTTTNNNQSADAHDAGAIHRRAIVVDMHADTTQRLVDENIDLQQRLKDGHLDSVRAKEGGLDAQFFSIWVEPDLFGGGGARAMKRADIQIEAVRNLAAKHSDTWEVATTAADIRRSSAEGKMAALMGLEGGYAIDEKLENVERYYRLGVRYMSPAWSVSTSWAVDVSHLSDKAFWDIVNTSTKPVIATHSGCRAITNVPRNLTDEMIVALAKTGGVVNVIFYPEHIEPGYSEKKKKVDAEIAPLVQRASAAEPGGVAQKKLARDRVRAEEYLKRLPPVSVSRIVDHIDHVVKLVGIDHVGIGSDFDGVQVVPADLKSVADLPNLTNELLKRGYSEADIDKILGGNMLRVMDEVMK